MEFKKISQAQLPLIADYLIENLGNRRIVLLQGEMGSGKTTLTKALCLKLGSKEEVSSPTYALVNEYACTNKLSITKLFHFDLYRLKNENELYEIGFEEYLNQTNSLCIIEWHERAENILQTYQFMKINIEVIDKEKRNFFIFMKP